MDRRQALAAFGGLILSGCGGGGGGGSGSVNTGSGTGAVASTSGGGTSTSTSTSSSSSFSSTPVPLSANIAFWGDSLTPPAALNLQLLVQGRTVFNGGVVGETSTQIAARQTSDTEHASWISVFWYGANNEDQPDVIKADIARSVAALSPGNRRFLVLGLVNQAEPVEELGGAVYALIVQLNRDLAALYPDNFYDMRAYLVSQYDPSNAQDVMDHQLDVVPSSLRFDKIHLDNDGSVLVAKKVKELVDAKGW